MFRLTLEMMSVFSKLGAFKFIHTKECDYEALGPRVGQLNFRHPEGWKFKRMKVSDGTHIVLVNKGEFKFKGKISLSQDRTYYKGNVVRMRRWVPVEQE